ncbi:hypothetical protein LINGRAHAP2_LOCUS37531 [Linum grandiflorum]
MHLFCFHIPAQLR